jgi:integrase
MSAEIKSKNDRLRTPWNKGCLVGQKRPLRPKEVWAIRVRLQMKQRKRDLALFNLAIDSKLRGCDLVSLRVDDIAAGGRVRDRATIIQHKTGRPVQFEIMEQTRVSLQEWLNARPTTRGPCVFPSRVHDQPHLTARQYARIVHGWIEGAGMDSSAYGTHSLRRTKAAQIYRKTGNLRAVQLLLGHSKIESTVRYLGIEVDDALTLSEQVEL